jgi:hypothetical protein
VFDGADLKDVVRGVAVMSNLSYDVLEACVWEVGAAGCSLRISAREVCHLSPRPHLSASIIRYSYNAACCG